MNSQSTLISGFDHCNERERVLKRSRELKAGLELRRPVAVQAHGTAQQRECQVQRPRGHRPWSSLEIVYGGRKWRKGEEGEEACPEDLRGSVVECSLSYTRCCSWEDGSATTALLSSVWGHGSPQNSQRHSRRICNLCS